MKNLGREAFFDLMMLSIVAGSADAAGFLSLGRVFTSNMTGNLVLLGIAAGEYRWGQALRTLLVLITFASGVILGNHLVRNFSDQDWKRILIRILAVENSLIFTFAALWSADVLLNRDPHFFLIGFLSLAMGLQSAAMSRLMIAGVTNTAITGTLTNLCIGIGNLWHAGSRTAMRKQMVEQFAVIILYCCGALCTSVLLHFAKWSIGFVPAIVALAVLVRRLVRR